MTGDNRFNHHSTQNHGSQWIPGTSQKIEGIYEKLSLSIKEPIYYGSWCGRKEVLPGLMQDIIIAIKE